MKKCFLNLCFLILFSNQVFADDVSVNTLNFNGSSQYLDLGDNLDVGNGTMSISLWFKTSGNGSNMMLISKYGLNYPGWDMYMENADGTIHTRFDISSSSRYDFKTPTSVSYKDNQWHHVVWVLNRTNSTPIVYIDGQLITMVDANSSGTVNTGNSDTASKLLIGARDISTSRLYYSGSMSSINIFNSDLSSADATELYNAGVPKQPWLHSSTIKDLYSLSLPLNDGVADGREFEDYSGNEKNPTLVGNPTLTGATLTTSTGQVYNSYSFDGINDDVVIAHDTSLDLGNGDKTHSIWFKTSSTSRQVIFGKGNPTGDFYDIYCETGQVLARVIDSGAQPRLYRTNTNTFNDGVWHHLVVRWNSFGTFDIYIDNIAQATTLVLTGTASDISSTDNLEIGNATNNNGRFNGSLVQPMMFNRTLSTSEIGLLYNQNLPRFYAEIPTSITEDCVLALEMTSNDNSLSDLSIAGNDGTANGGVTSNGAEIDWMSVVATPPENINTTLGTNAGVNNTGIDNTFLGSNTGLSNITGEGNVFLGSYAGSDETGSNKLYIANSNTATPLIYGEFDNQKLQVNGELRVTGGILANKVDVKLVANWPDYVFAKGYKLLTLKEVENYINEHKHLPGIPSAKEIENNTLPIDEVMVKQMEKIEELTLYIIDLSKENSQSSQMLEKLKKQNETILNRLNTLEKEQK